MASRLNGSPSRIVLDLIKEHKVLTRKQIYLASPRDIIPSKRRVKIVLQNLQEQRRVKAFLEVGKVDKVDNWVYKLNPMREEINFPHTAKTNKGSYKELQYVLSLGDDEPIVGTKVTTVDDGKKFVSFKDDVFDPNKE